MSHQNKQKLIAPHSVVAHFSLYLIQMRAHLLLDTVIQHCKQHCVKLNSVTADYIVAITSMYLSNEVAQVSLLS